MPKTIPQLEELLRDPQAGDLVVVETPEGTRSADAQKFLKLLKKHLYTSTGGGETEIAIPFFEQSVFSIVWLSMQPLEEYTGPEPVPGAMYKNVFNQSKILLGDPLEPGEKVLILHY